MLAESLCYGFSSGNSERYMQWEQMPLSLSSRGKFVPIDHAIVSFFPIHLHHIVNAMESTADNLNDRSRVMKPDPITRIPSSLSGARTRPFLKCSAASNEELRETCKMGISAGFIESMGMKTP